MLILIFTAPEEQRSIYTDLFYVEFGGLDFLISLLENYPMVKGLMLKINLHTVKEW